MFKRLSETKSPENEIHRIHQPIRIYLDEISEVIKPQLLTIIDELSKLNHTIWLVRKHSCVRKSVEGFRMKHVYKRVQKYSMLD